jgi:hypothetical protein
MLRQNLATARLPTDSPELLLGFVTKRFEHMNAGSVAHCRHFDTFRHIDTTSPSGAADIKNSLPILKRCFISVPPRYSAPYESIPDADGSAIIIHITADDNITDPAGNSGDRVACGVTIRTVVMEM